MDDEESIRHLLNTVLGRIGYETRLARDGSEAIEFYRKARDAGRPFHAVICDLTIKGGMSGKEAIKELKSIDPQVKAIVASGYNDDPVLADYRKYGFSGVIAKPFKISELSYVLQEIINGGTNGEINVA